MSPSSSSQIDKLKPNTNPTSPQFNNHDTLASAYLVCGLPKNPQCWTLSQPDSLPSHLPNALPRFWRPEVLGTTISGQDSISLTDSNLNSSASSIPSTSKTSPSKNHHMVSTHLNQKILHPFINKDELSRIQTKAIKLAFPRDVEIIASNLQPPSTTHCFSFQVPPNSNYSDQHLLHPTIGQQWELIPSLNPLSSNSSSCDKTYYAACLQVWSHSDKLRSDAIKKTLEESSSKSKSIAIARAIQAAAAGRKFDSKLQSALNSPKGLLSISNHQINSTQQISIPGSSINTKDSHLNNLLDITCNEIEDTDAFFSESEWETHHEITYHDSITSRLINNKPKTGQDNTDQNSITHHTPLWLPHCLILISKFPLFDLMVDHLKISWARYHDSIHKHSKEMLKILNFPIYKSTSLIKFPVGPKDSNTKFVVQLPGKTDLSNSTLEQVNFTMWPLFKCLSISHIISIYEIGLSPMGRIVFFSNYSAMLNLAVESLKILLELRGWNGLSQSIIHSRDFKIYLEDPGPFILGANSQMRHIAANISPEIMVVDLDTDTIDCQKAHPTALSKGQERTKIEKKIFHYLGNFNGPRSVPTELHEAFPAGRFRPFSAVEIQDQPSEAERLLPPAEWNWDQSKTIIILDNIMSKMPTKGIAKLLKRKTYRQAAVLDSSALHVQEIIRKHTISFVNRRDVLETKIWKLNRRLAFLMSESMDWKQHFEHFQKFTDLLSQESLDLKTRLENERKEHINLTGVVAEQLNRQAELENRLLETEKAWMAAQVELAKAHDIREELQRQKQMMVSEMKSIALGEDDEELLGKIVPRVESCIGLPGQLGGKNRMSLMTKNFSRLSTPAAYSPEPPDRSSSRIDSNETIEIEIDRSPSQLGSSVSHYQLSAADSDDETISDDVSGMSEIMEERALLSRSVVIEAMRSIQGRLESVLRTAGQLDEEELKSFDSSTGLGKSALSRLSTDSYDSKVIHLQRGRRRPNSSLFIERERSNASKSPSSPHNSIQNEHYSNKIDFSCEMENLNSKRSSRTSTVSLILPGSRIFGQRSNSASPRDSASVSSIAPSSLSHRVNGVLHEASEAEEEEDEEDEEEEEDNDDDEEYGEEEEEDDDDDDDRGTSFDDGASFVSAYDDTDSAELMLNSVPRVSSQPDHVNPISRVSLIAAAPFELYIPDQPHPSFQKPTESNAQQASHLISFPTTDSLFDQENKQSLDGSGDLISPFSKINELKSQVDSSSADLTKYKKSHDNDQNRNLIRSNKNQNHVDFVHHRISNISNSSSSTIKIKHNPNLPHHHLEHPLPKRLHRKSYLSNNQSTLSELPLNLNHPHPSDQSISINHQT